MRTSASIAAALLAAAMLLPAAARAAPVFFTATLTGEQEVPGPGDPDGFGTADVVIDDEALTVSWDIDFSGIALPLTGAHIHVGPAGVAGPIIVDFMEQPTGSGLFDPDLADVLADPQGHYVNLHNAIFPAGAIRGQLRPVSRVAEPGTLAVMLTALGLLGLGGPRVRRTTPC